MQKLIPKTHKINWDTPQWVIHKEQKDFVVLVTNSSISTFEGTCLPCESWPNGAFDKYWVKDNFELLTYDIDFKISNK